MEQQLDATYLAPGLLERAIALAIAAGGIGIAVLLSGWGVSLVFRVGAAEAMTAHREKPPVSDAAHPQITQNPFDRGASDGQVKTEAGHVIRREVTVFFDVQHRSGKVVTGWNYADGGGKKPVGQYCYFSSPNGNGSNTQVNIGSNGSRLPRINADVVPDIEGALSKCQWFKG